MTDPLENNEPTKPVVFTRDERDLLLQLVTCQIAVGHLSDTVLACLRKLGTDRDY